MYNSTVKQKYINTFLNELSDKDKKEIYFDQFIWHAFSYKKVSCLEGIDAINELKKRKKNEVILFFQDNDEIIEFKNLTYNNLIKLIWNNEIPSDCYIVDKNFKWTFVYTHETLNDRDIEDNWYYIGPFFKSL